MSDGERRKNEVRTIQETSRINMKRKLAVLMVFVMGVTAFAVLNMTIPVKAPPLPDLQLGGDVYICNSSTPLNGTVWEDSVGFAIWVNNSTTTPPFYKWTRYPLSGYLMTNKGKYATVLPDADRDKNWSNGAEYRVEIDGTPWGGRITNATSNGSGSYVTSGGVLPNDGDPEFTNVGNISNYIAYWIWGDPLNPQTDDYQKWDLITNCVDYRPTNITIDDGINPPFGPYDATSPSFPDPLGTFVVPTGQSVTLTANATNVHDSFVNRTTTIAFWNETPAGSGNLDWFEIGSTPSIPAMGTVVPVPNSATWPGSLTPGTYDIYITVDFPGNFTEYNTSSGFPPNYGNVTELVDTDMSLPGLQYLYPQNTNNTVRITLLVEGPDLIPGDPTSPDGIYFDAVQVPDADGVSPSDPIPVNPGTTHTVTTNVTNIGLDTGQTFNVSFYQSDNSMGICEGDTFLGTDQVLNGLAAGTTVGPLPTIPLPWVAPFEPGDVWINITVDNNSDVQETIETNNYYCIHLIVGGPDLIPGDVTSPDGIYVNGIQVPDSDGISPSDQITVGLSTTLTISSNVSNAGSPTIQTFSIAFYESDNSTGMCEGDIFLGASQIIGGLGSGATTGPFSVQWTTPPVPTDAWINITVDNNTNVQEMNEANNYYCIHLNVMGLPDLIPYNGNDILINGVQYVPPAVGNISIDLTTGQVINIASVVKNVGVASQIEPYTYRIFINQTSSVLPNTGSPLHSNILSPPLNPSEESAQQSLYWMAYLVSDIYYIFLNVDPGPQGDSNNANNTLIIEINVYELPPPPLPILEVDHEADDITITWTNVSDEDIVIYNIYWAISPDELNFSEPSATVKASGNQIAFTQEGGVSEAPELYYAVRSVDVRGWEGPSSDVVAKFTIEIPPGYSTFSLPLEPFETKTVSWYLDDMNLDSGDVIFSYDSSSQRWIPHPKFLPQGISDFDLVMGETYMVYSRDGKPQYTFVGRPGTTIRYNIGTDNPGTHLDDWRIGTDHDFITSLSAVEDGNDIVLSWSWNDTWNLSAFESLSSFNVYRAQSRGGIDFTNPFAQIPSNNLTWKDVNAAGDEYYYLVMPVNTNGREGSSTFAVGVKRVTYGEEYNDFALYLQPLESKVLSGYLNDLDLTDEEVIAAIYYFGPSPQTWIPHPAFIPAGITDPEVGLSDGNLIYIVRSKEYTYIGT